MSLFQEYMISGTISVRIQEPYIPVRYVPVCFVPVCYFPTFLGKLNLFKRLKNITGADEKFPGAV